MTNKQILAKLGEDYDITLCKVCGNEIVVNEAEMEYPMCNRIDCVAWYLERSA